MKFITQNQRNMKAQGLKIQSDNGTEFKNASLRSFYEKLGILHQKLTARMPQQNCFVEHRNRTLVEATRIMLIFFKLPKFLWAEAISIACLTRNRSLVHTRYNKTPYELIKGRKPNVQYFHVFGSLCYSTNDRDDLGKMKPKTDIEEMSEIPLQQDLDNLLGPLYEEYYAPRTSEVSDNSVANNLDNEDTPSSSSIIVEDNYAPQIVSSVAESIAQESSTLVLDTHSDEQIQEDAVELDGNTIMHSFETPEFEEAESSLNFQDPSNMHESHQQHRYIDKWTKMHPIEQVFGDPSKPIQKEVDSEPMQSCMDVKTSFLNGPLKEEVFISQPDGFVDPDFCNHVYHLKKLYTVSKKPLEHARIDAVLQGTPTDQTKYRSIIGGLMYLTTSRPDIAFETFVCARYQARPTEKHLKEVKGIFRYLRQSINMGLWYSKDSGFELIAYSDVDHAGCHDDCKSTSGGL
ncbi:retrovirus-related pol polyprotein from transposon TNT 1-94 [Tanacetum coccineum]